MRPVASLIAALAVVLAACTSTDPTPTPSADSTGEPTPVAATDGEATPAPTEPVETPEPMVDVPLAVVTGYTSVRAALTQAEVENAIANDTIIQACELFTAVNPVPRCLDAIEIVPHLEANPGELALLPAGLVEPTVKALPVDGADLFGGPAARERPYPLTAAIQGPPEGWAHDPGEIRTLISLGDSCPDRGVAHAAITLGRGWEWVFGGGTAEYTAVYPNPAPPGTVGNGFNIVDAVPTGNEGAVAELVSGADVTVDDFECPVVENWRVNDGVIFTIDPRVLDHLRDDYGVDVVTLAANHLFDAGTSGFLETLDRFDGAGIARTGAGRDLDEALEPAIIEVSGLRFGFVGFNEIPGSIEAAPGQPGVAWLREDQMREGVRRARERSDVVLCLPQWWGGAEYHATWYPSIRAQQEIFFDAGCDQILGHGTHWSGPVDFTDLGDGRTGFTIMSHGNFLFGQSWSQQTQEGVIVELAFSGTRLVQARMHPYIMLEQAQTNLVDPETDGMYVLGRIYDASGLPRPAD
jgi:poly-gamma-glutamate capsule biosynthesis protein CapA/YwtB (metallophosphatase superfamily)